MPANGANSDRTPLSVLLYHAAMTRNQSLSTFAGELDIGAISLRQFLLGKTQRPRQKTLELLMTREVEDARRGLLRAGIAGDLEGWSQWHVRPEEDGTTVAGFEQEVEVTASLLARSAPLAGPLLRANHTWMMRRGEAGLAAYLA